MRLPILMAGSLMMLASCAHTPELRTDLSVPRAPGNDKAALVEAAGVRIVVAPDAWKGEPTNLAEVYTPLQVRIENGSGKMLRINYPDFGLVGANGFRYAAIPPLSAMGAVAEAAPVPVRTRFYGNGFFVAPHYWPYYPGYARWAYPFPYDPLYFDTYYGYWAEPLPSKDMVAEALPEGVIQESGHVAGFIYFRSIVTKESRVTFEVNLVDASNGQAFGKITIPFTVNR